MLIDINGKSEYFFGSDRFDQIAYLINKPYYGPRPSKNNPKLWYMLYLISLIE